MYLGLTKLLFKHSPSVENFPTKQENILPLHPDLFQARDIEKSKSFNGV